MSPMDGSSADAPITPSALAAMPDFRIGNATVSPSRRIIESVGGKGDVEPRVMQVLVALAQSAGTVVTRKTLFDRCWGGIYVGDDSLNRTVAAVRRVVSNVAPGSFEIETIPRTGYRLIGEVSGVASEAATGEQADHGGRFSRRLMLGSAGALIAATGAGLWWNARERNRADALIEEGERVLREAWPGSDEKAVGYLQSATALNPGDAHAWGLLAIALRNVAEQAAPNRTTAAVLASERAANRALMANPRDGNALTALATVRPEFGNWAETEDALRHALKVDRDNPAAINYLVMLLQSVGRAHESWKLNERLARIQRSSPVYEFRKALKLWIFGRVPEADLTIDRALQMWPRHPAVWNARLYIFAFTGRPEAGSRMIEDDRFRPSTFGPASARYWRSSLRALATRSEGDIAGARTVNLQLAPRSPGFAVAAMMVLSALGEIDSAFGVAQGALLRSGPLIGTIWAGNGEMPVNDQYWRRTMNLFTPATAAMRGDPRFRPLCDGMGMTVYWRQRGIWPDPFLRMT